MGCGKEGFRRGRWWRSIRGVHIVVSDAVVDGGKWIKVDAGDFSEW